MACGGSVALVGDAHGGAPGVDEQFGRVVPGEDRGVDARSLSPLAAPESPFDARKYGNLRLT